MPGEQREGKKPKLLSFEQLYGKYRKWTIYGEAFNCHPKSEPKHLLTTRNPGIAQEAKSLILIWSYEAFSKDKGVFKGKPSHSG